MKTTTGASYRMGAWTLHLTGGYQFEGSRTVASGDVPRLPGRYTNRGGSVHKILQAHGYFLPLFLKPLDDIPLPRRQDVCLEVVDSEPSGDCFRG